MTDLFAPPDPVGAPSQTGERDSNGIRWSNHRPPRPYIFDLEKGKEAVWSRCTSWIDCLDDRSVLERWKQRIILVGLSVDPNLIEQVLAVGPDDSDALAEISDAAFEAGDGWVRTHKGTDLHRLCELADSGQPWQADATDTADVLAYRNAVTTYGFEMVGMEKRVVVDAIRVTGTLDRVIETTRDIRGPLGDLVLAKGHRFIADIKTGRIDYSSSRVAMQLAVYARGMFYDGWTQERTPMEGVSQDQGLVIHLPQGEANCTVHLADLQQGWEGVLLAQQVRAWRNRNIPLEPLPAMQNHVQVLPPPLLTSHQEATSVS